MIRLLVVSFCFLTLFSCKALIHQDITKTYQGYNEWGSHWSVWVTPNKVHGDSIAIWAYSTQVSSGNRGRSNNLYLNNKYIKGETGLIIPQDVYTKTKPGKYQIELVSIPYTYALVTKRLRLKAGDSVAVVMQFVPSMQNADILKAPVPPTRKERRAYKKLKKQQKKND